jgi:DNA transposition AAA+ family ATPase
VEKKTLYDSVAPLRNVGALAALIDRVKGRTHSLPGMGTFYGPSGFGKTMAAVYCTNRFGAITVQVKSAWSKKTLCEAILAEIGLPAGATIARMLDQISDHLALSDAPLLIDEADFLVQRNMIEIVRDIYEGSGAPVILIGEELLPQKLRAWERVHGRILDWVAAEPGDLSDVAHLSRIYAPDLAISADLQAKLVAASRGSIRRICVNLDRLREFAATRGVRSLSAADWGSQAFFTGAAPEVRRFEGEVARTAARARA